MNNDNITISGITLCCVPLPWGVMVMQNSHNITFVKGWVVDITSEQLRYVSVSFANLDVSSRETVT